MTAQTDLYDGIVNDVVTLTNRPDLAAEIAIAVRTATLSVHSDAAYPRDLVAAAVQIPNPSYQFSIDAQSQFPRLRGLSTVRLLDDNFTPVEFPEVEIIELGDIRDAIYHELKTDVCYIAGTSVNVKTSVPASGILLEYFQLPLIRREQYNSWIAQLAPDAIVYSAASILYSTNGNEEKAASYSKFYQTQLKPQLIANFLTSAMR